jgi:beta-galactosidase GanA
VRTKLLVAALLLTIGAAAAPAPAAPVEWDRYSMKLRGKRVFLDSGEVHPFRMPGPAMWRDVLQKLRASGLNSISIYVPWQLHEIEPGRFRFGGRYDL